MTAFTDYTDDDRFALAGTIYGEARGEPALGKVAVGYVVRNRAEHFRKNGRPAMFGTGTLASAAFAAFQFSCWNKTSPEAATMVEVLLGKLNADPIFMRCLGAADAVLSGLQPDPTAGALWYHTLAMGNPAGWGEPDAVIGAHAFYKRLDG